MCGAETWTFDRHQADILLVRNIDFLRRAARNSTQEKIRNLKIREIMNIQHNIYRDGVDIPRGWEVARTEGYLLYCSNNK